MLGLLSDQKKKKKPQLIDANPIEAVRDFSGAVRETVKQDVARKGSEDFIKQLLGKELSQSSHGDLVEGQELVLSGQQESQENTTVRKADLDPAINYHREIRFSSERGTSRERSELNAKIDQILVELDQLIDSSSELEARFEQMAVETKPVEPGTYHLNFFDWVINLIQTTRQQIEDSGSWLQALSGKKQKQNYWSMFKKHGTSFGMSSERMVATQTG